MHPQLEIVATKVDEFMLAYPTVSQYDRLAEVEKKTGYPKAYFFIAAVSALLSFISLLGGMKLISDLIGFLYPAYMSFKAIESAGTEDDTQWLTYWVVFATFSIAESTIMFVLEYIPFYFIVKTVFMAWLFHPKFMGAALLYKQAKPMLQNYLVAVEKSQKPQPKDD